MKKFFTLVGICLLSVNPLGADTSVSEKGAIQVETLSRSTSSWDGKAYTAYPKARPELTVLKITIPPNSELAWHKHPMPNAAYVLSGTLTIEKKVGGKKKVFTQGQVALEVVNNFHRGRTGNKPVVLIVFYASTPGMPLSQAL
jgi:quercetin dioxygenase-like cupin family protein